MFESYEISTQSGQPIWLYQFSTGVYLTSAESEIVHGGHTYAPAPVKHGKIAASGSLDDQTLSVYVPRDSALVEAFLEWPPSETVVATIFQGHAPDDEFLAAWSGRVVGLKIDELAAAFTCESIVSALGRPGLRRNWQVSCPFVLYSARCGALKAGTTLLVMGIDGAEITATWQSGPAPVPAQFPGTLEQGGEVRNVKSVAYTAPTATIVVRGSTDRLSVGEAITLFRGCNRTLNACQEFGNAPNFGGCPLIPLKNPARSASFFL